MKITSSFLIIFCILIGCQRPAFVNVPEASTSKAPYYILPKNIIGIDLVFSKSSKTECACFKELKEHKMKLDLEMRKRLEEKDFGITWKVDTVLLSNHAVPDKEKIFQLSTSKVSQFYAYQFSYGNNAIINTGKTEYIGFDTEVLPYALSAASTIFKGDANGIASEVKWNFKNDTVPCQAMYDQYRLVSADLYDLLKSKFTAGQDASYQTQLRELSKIKNELLEALTYKETKQTYVQRIYIDPGASSKENSRTIAFIHSKFGAYIPEDFFKNQFPTLSTIKKPVVQTNVSLVENSNKDSITKIILAWDKIELHPFVKFKSPDSQKSYKGVVYNLPAYYVFSAKSSTSKGTSILAAAQFAVAQAGAIGYIEHNLNKTDFELNPLDGSLVKISGERRLFSTTAVKESGAAIEKWNGRKLQQTNQELELLKAQHQLMLLRDSLGAPLKRPR
ncbi:MAG: DUF4831 family protein [Cytophagaceae bacterium]|nr:DUF4831 family protein [Cytophagaceae bacterium]